MKNITALLLFLLCSFFGEVFGQACTLPGMTPSSAIPVCGIRPFGQNQIVNCTGQSVAIRGCSDNVRSDRSFWYKFTCYQAGTLGFTISGVSPSDDYDWVLYDITGRDPNEVFTNNNLQVSINIYGTFDDTPFPNSPTGCIPSGNGDVHCSGDENNNTPFNRMPTLVLGHEYLLMVANFSNSTAGYTLNFVNGTASITDPISPRLSRASAACDTRQVRVKLNKKMKCNSLAPNGSDFTINAPGITVTAASGIGCSGGFDMDSVLLTLSAPLAPGNYIVSAANGSDANTLLDYCDRAVPVGDNIPLVILPIAPTPMDSLTTPGCSPTSVSLVFPKPINCASIAANGSDFVITGPSAVTITGATGSCSGGNTGVINVQLAAPIQLGGTYRITLQNGSDGNTLLDECALQTPAGSFIDFEVADTVNANFTYNIIYGCDQNTVQYNHNGANDVNSWSWTFEGVGNSSQQNPFITYTDFREKNIRLIVSNGVCSDTAETSIFFDNLLVAKFEGPQFVCPNEPITFVDQSEGTISSYNWTFGNGNTSTLQNPPAQTYAVPTRTYDQEIRLIIRNSFGCADTASHMVKVVNNCYIAVPSAFTPNNDGLNDYLYPLNAYKALNLTFSVFNRFGQRVFFTRDWMQRWDGAFKGQGCDPGTYVWMLQYTHLDTGQRVEQKGTVILIR